MAVRNGDPLPWYHTMESVLTPARCIASMQTDYDDEVCFEATRALRNLARNAIEHTAEPDGLVRLDVKPLGPDHIRFEVSDDGPGIPVHERERVFERFHRTDSGRTRATGGAGLGLAIVRAIAEAHKGTVRVSDASGGHGAAVELVLPGFHGV